MKELSYRIATKRYRIQLVHLEFWKYASTGVRLPTDIWIHTDAPEGSKRRCYRMHPDVTTRNVRDIIIDAKHLAEAVGAEFKISSTVIPTSIP